MANNFVDVSMTIINNNARQEDDESTTNKSFIHPNDKRQQKKRHQQQQIMNCWKFLFHVPLRKIFYMSSIIIILLLILSSIGFILYFIFYVTNDDINDGWINNLLRPKIKFKHHNNKELYSILDSYRRYYPKLTHLYTIGYTNRNNPIKVLEISDNPGIHEPGEAEIKLIGNIHGNEVVGRELLLYLIDHLLSTYHTNTNTKLLVDNLRIHIAPTINPDGYEDAIEDDCMGVVGRYNANGKDLNRNFPDQFITNKKNAVQEQETLAIMKWIKQYPFVLSVSLHGGALVVNYPFDNNEQMIQNETKCPDNDVFRYLSLIYSKNHPFMYVNNGRCTDSCYIDDQDDNFNQGITNGAQWYPVSGGMQDWNYLNSNCFELTIEVGCKKYPLNNELEKYWQQHKKSLLNFINSTYTGVHGFVFDNYGQPLNSTIISVENIDKNITTYEWGDYWRLLTPGHQYTIVASKNGYHSQNATIFIENSHQLNFTLEKIIL